MDTSEEYIQMCQRAKEIQEIWKPTSGDFVHSLTKNKIVVLYYNKHHGSPPDDYLPPNAIYLPRQDQIQKIMIRNFESEISRSQCGSYQFSP